MEPEHCRFSSSTDAVICARKAVTAYARACGFPESDVFDIALATGEICTNAVEHAHSDKGAFSVDCRYEEAVLTVAVRDGGGRDRALPVKDHVGGLGLFLVRSLTDHVSFQPTPSGTTVSFSKRRSVNAALAQ
ncbi:MAG: ATP-binding protein [Candidatus Eremiobacteraeota bacterium]|nr:ATP-binding protein [Candidatus Eremiobacteraeota bacterium]MBC5827875.1 ATP-binding protein [Candidatus Eremiobacteraeota bacterium]